jgi:hypothetical protein
MRSNPAEKAHSGAPGQSPLRMIESEGIEERQHRIGRLESWNASLG